MRLAGATIYQMEPINWNELLEDPAAIEGSLLQRVIGVGAGRTVNGTTIELLALELRELGAFGSLRIEMPSRTGRQVALFTPEVVVRDDAGTRYAVNVQGSSGMHSGGASSMWLRHQFSIVPAISARASRLIILVGRIGNQLPYHLPTPEGSVDMLSEPGWIEGPWTFEVPL